MSDRLFVIAMDTTDPQLDLGLVEAFLKKDGDIKGWWNHIPGVFFVETELNADALTDRIRDRVGAIRFIAVETRPEQMNGLLPERSWEWLSRRSIASRKLQSTPSE